MSVSSTVAVPSQSTISTAARYRRRGRLDRAAGTSVGQLTIAQMTMTCSVPAALPSFATATDQPGLPPSRLVTTVSSEAFGQCADVEPSAHRPFRVVLDLEP